ncbi:MAG: hypothetical protein KAT27_10075 [Desulfobacterales bacterium]|nr:hypothetical protein [Desulfobacterales bacterium]
MNNKPILITLLLLTILLIYREHETQKQFPLPKERCLFCHKNVSDPDTSHPISAFGCYICHLGNPFSLDKERGHLTMVKNPGDLSIAHNTCGKADCHPEIVNRVKNSIMATNKGIIKILRYHWEGIEETDMDVEMLMASEGGDDLSIELYRKMCGGCHLWKKRKDLPGEIGRRGGGCSNCHIVEQEGEGGSDMEHFKHPQMTIRIPSENCTKCHNRSARIGLSYFGQFESEGYGTPYEGKGLNHRRLSGQRFYINLPADIHYTKANMECIDCHTGKDIMGDGNRYDLLKDQLDITCEACHQPDFIEIKKKESLAERLVFLNKKVPSTVDKKVGISKKESPLYNLQKVGDDIFFYRKMDGKAIKMQVPAEEKAYHRMPGHERLSCQACHAKWIPQCYGCHYAYRRDLYQGDWLTRRISTGRWEELRSYLRFSKPTLGVNSANKIAPFSPCQVYVSQFDEHGHYVPAKSLKILTMSSFDPHTTQKTSRTCLDCHGDPKSLGFGEGILYRKEGEWGFRPTYDSWRSSLDIHFPLDAFVTLDGVPLQTTSRKGARPFNQEELKSIMAVNACLPCHNDYQDKIYLNFKESMKKFQTKRDLPCWKIIRRYAP